MAGRLTGARQRRRALWIALVSGLIAAIVLLVVLAAHHSRAVRSAASARAASGAVSSGGDVGGRVASLRLTSIEGRAVSLPAGRPGALFFTTSDCTSCIASARALGTIKTRFGARANAVYISIDSQDSPSALAARRDSIGDPPYPFAVDTSGKLATQYRVQALGTTVIYDARGRIVDRLVEPTLSELADGFRKAGLT
jgi:peroxiredoxin